MTPFLILSATIAILSVLSALGSISMAVYLFSTERRAPKFMHEKAKKNSIQSNVLLSVIITAKNEEKVIGRCLSSLVSQTYQNVEILVVDDGSSDRTVQISEELAKQDKRIHIVSAGEKPKGWIGKSWPCQRGYENSKGQVLLFVDADSIFDPSTIELTLSYIQENSIDIFSISPKVELEGVWANSTMPLLAGAINLLYPMSRVNDKKSKRAYVFGTFILVSRKTYDAIGGHAKVKDKLVEDAALANEAKVSGFNLRVERGNDLITTEWEKDSKVIFHGLERVFSDSVRPYGPVALLNAVLVFFLSIFPILVVLSFLIFLGLDGARYPLFSLESIAVLASIVSIACLVFTFSRELKQTSGRVGAYPVLYPLGCILFILAIISASLKVSRGGKFEWKGSNYAQ